MFDSTRPSGRTLAPGIVILFNNKYGQTNEYLAATLSVGSHLGILQELDFVQQVIIWKLLL